MDCRQIQTLFTAYTDQELDQQNLLLFEKHLDTCPHCFNEWEGFQEILRRLRAVEPLTAPSGLLPGIHEKLARRSFGCILGQTVKKIFAPLSLTAGASAMAAAMMIAFFVNSGSAPESPAVSSTDGLSLQETKSSSLPMPLAKPINLDPILSRRPADQLLLTPSIFSAHPAEDDRSAYQFYRYLLNSGQTGLGRASNWHQNLDLADSSLLIPQWHKQQIGMPLMPDITIRIHHLSPDGLDRLHSQIKEANNWQTRCYHRDYFLVLLNPGEIDVLYSLLQQQRLPFSSHTFQDADRLSQKPLLVAVRL